MKNSKDITNNVTSNELITNKKLPTYSIPFWHWILLIPIWYYPILTLKEAKYNIFIYLYKLFIEVINLERDFKVLNLRDYITWFGACVIGSIQFYWLFRTKGGSLIVGDEFFGMVIVPILGVIALYWFGMPIFLMISTITLWPFIKLTNFVKSRSLQKVNRQN
jgi:hypothetical protein